MFSFIHSFQIFQYLIEIFGYKEIVGKICAHSGNIDITSQTDLQIIFVTDDVNNENTGFVASFTQTLGMSLRQYASTAAILAMQDEW